MSSRQAHSIVGISTGLVAAACACPETERWKRAAELFGGAFGGYWGSRLPDILEPATSPNHRKTAHAVLPMGTCCHFAVKQASVWQTELRERALSILQNSDEARQVPLANQTIALILYILAGAVAGFVAGYASHLILDSTTRKGLPLF